MSIPRICSCAILILAVLALSGIGSSASAFQPQPENSKYEIPLREFDLYGYRSTVAAGAARSAAARFERQNGGAWQVLAWNPQTRTPSYLCGSGVDIAPPLASEEALADLARQVIAANPAVFRAEVADLRLDAIREISGKRAVHFQQTYHGLDVWGGGAHLTFTDQGRLFVMGSEYYPGIVVDPVPTLGANAAQRLAREALPFDARTDYIESAPELLVLPVPRTETEVDYHLVWRVRVRTADPLGIWVTHVDAHDGTIVWRYNDIHFADFSGDAEGLVEPATWCNGTEHQIFKYMEVSVDGVGETITDQDGNWWLEYPGSDDREVTATLFGPYIRVDNTAGPNGTFSGTATPGVPFHIDFDDWWAQRDELDCFDAVNDIHDFFEQVDPGFGYVFMRMQCNVSIDATCNAFYDGTINFYRQGDGCANTGQIQGVVHHEFGHGVQHYIIGWQGEQGCGEGNSDVLANLMTQESVIGRGFYLADCIGGIRDSDNGLIWPDDVLGQEIHYAGQVIAGFHWDFMVAMQNLYGFEPGTIYAAWLWHNCRVLERPTLQPDQVIAAFIADDDDGDLSNGTPHHDQLSDAARNHGFDEFIPEILAGVQIEHEPLWTMTDEGDAEVVATIWSVDAEMDADSILCRYWLNDGEMVQLHMQPTGGENEYSTMIPDLTYGDVVEYYLRGVDVLGNAANHPEMAPDELHVFGVATVFDPMEEESGWVVNLEGTDTAERGQWVREDPIGTRAQPEDDHTPDPGVLCWITGNGVGPPGAYDVDNGITSLYSPVYDLAGSQTAMAMFWRWYSNDGDNAPYTDYWGVWVRNNGGDWVEVEYTNFEDENEWVAREVDLLATFGEELGEIQFVFAAADTGELSMVEAGVDDFSIIARQGSSVPGGPADGPRFALHGSRSVPVSGYAEIAFQIPTAAPVRLDLFDVGGRVVRVLADQPFAAGRHTVPWDGRDSGGRAVPSGVYYCRMETPGFRTTRTLVVSR